jgi:primase-polymerase (primpol)-like protein
VSVENGSGKPKKVPVDASGRPVDHTKPHNFLTFADACEIYSRGRVHGIGFAFTDSDPFVGVDLDRCRRPLGGELSSDAVEILRSLGTYAEVSPSGTGVKAIGIGGLDPEGPKRRGAVEVYDRNRYFALTGRTLPDFPGDVRACGDAVLRLQDSLRPAAREILPPATSRGEGCQSDDAEILRRVFSSKNAATILSYWSGNLNGKPSASEALLALAQLLAFYTGPDEARLERLVKDSPLFAATESSRPKWDSPRGGSTWGRAFIVKKAIDTCARFYEGDRHQAGGETAAKVQTQLVDRVAPFGTVSKRRPPHTCVSMVCIKGVNAPGAEVIKGRTARAREGKQRLLALLWQLCGRKIGGKCFLSILDGAERLSVDPATVARWLIALRDQKLIGRTFWGSRRSQKASEYVYRGAA